MSEMAKKKLGEILVERGFISEEQLEEALRAGKRLGEALLEMRALSADELNWALSELLGVPYVEFRDEMVDFDLARAMPEEVLRRHLAFPVLRIDDELTVILSDPTNRQAVSELEALTGAKVTVALAARETILHLLDRAFPPGTGVPGRVRYAEVGAGGATVETDPSGVAQVHALLVGALGEGATEIHLEPLAGEVRVRNRVDGRLVDRARMPRSVLASVIARFRIMAGLRGASLPRQACVRTRLERQEIELELLFFPTLHGEAVTVRIWRSAVEAPTLAAFELSGADRDALSRLTDGAGLVLATGPDPRARAALLYALAQAVAVPSKKVVTLERAVSFIVPEFVQVELPGDFGEGAATILAHPADVVLVEDLSGDRTCLAGVGSAERGALVLGGLCSATNVSGLARLFELNVPRVSLLAGLRGLVNVQQLGSRHQVEVLAMTEERRHEILGGQGPWTSPIS